MKNTEMLLIFLRIIFKIKVEYNCDLPTLNLDNKVNDMVNYYDNYDNNK